MVTLNLPADFIKRHNSKCAAKVRLVESKAKIGKSRSVSLVIQPDPAVRTQTLPIVPPAPPSPPIRRSTGKTAPTTPHPQVNRVCLSPMTTLDTFIAAHIDAHWGRRDYLHPGYKSRPSLNRATQATFDQRQALFLHANNMWSRTRYAGVFGEHLERFAAQLAAGERIFLVTLVNRDHTVPRKTAAAFDVARVKGWVHQVLRGTSYVGMVEAAYFSNLRLLDPFEHRHVSWHTHILLWGITEAELVARCNEINGRYVTAVEGVPAAHYRVLQLEEVFGRSIYICKAPLAEYRLWARKKECFDRDTGEIFECFSGRFRVRSRPIRPGDWVHMSSVFIDKHLTQLAFAAGEGRQILRGINAEALAAFNRWEAQQGYMKGR